MNEVTFGQIIFDKEVRESRPGWQKFVHGCGRISTNPNFWTGVRGAVGLLALGISFSQIWLGLILLVISTLIDVIDGAIARMFDRKTKWGPLIDATIDKVVNMSWIVAWWGLQFGWEMNLGAILILIMFTIEGIGSAQRWRSILRGKTGAAIQSNLASNVKGGAQLVLQFGLVLWMDVWFCQLLVWAALGVGVGFALISALAKESPQLASLLNRVTGKK